MDRSRIGRKSRTKGNRFEVEVAKAIAERLQVPYEECCRTPSSGALIERSDLRFSERVRRLFPWFIECKRRESWSLDAFFQPRGSVEVWKWYEDAFDKAGKDPVYRGGTPPPIMLVLGRNRMTPLVFMASDDLATYARARAVSDDWSGVCSLRVIRSVPENNEDMRFIAFPLSHFLGHYVRPFGA